MTTKITPAISPILLPETSPWRIFLRIFAPITQRRTDAVAASAVPLPGGFAQALYKQHDKESSGGTCSANWSGIDCPPTCFDTGRNIT